MTPRRPLLAVLGGLLLAGCPIGNDRYPKPADLTPAWKIDRLRVLAIRAEPPEVRPGETATFEALVLDPEGDAAATAWLACPPEDDDGVGFGCGLDGSIDFSAPDPSGFADAGVIGFEPFLQPEYTATEDDLAGVAEDERSEGTYVLVQIAVLPPSVLQGEGEADPDVGGQGGFDFNEVEVAYKRLIVSEAPTPNANPAIDAFTVDGQVVPEQTTILVDPGRDYEIGMNLLDGTVETYQFVTDDGDIEERTEEPYVTWYTDGGEMRESATLFPFLDATWRAPEADADITEGTWWGVVRDRRGGMTWVSRRWRLR